MIGFDSLLNKTATLMRMETFQTDTGSIDEDWTDIVSFDCALKQHSQTENFQMSKVTDTSTHRMYCRPVTAKANDRVRIDNVPYLITSVYDVMGLSEIMQIDLELVDGL